VRDTLGWSAAPDGGASIVLDGDDRGLETGGRGLETGDRGLETGDRGLEGAEERGGLKAIDGGLT